MGMPTEYKRFPAFISSIDDEQGVVNALVAVTGNLDYQGDIIEPGSFKKTIAERGLDIQVLDNHRSGSCADVVGVPVGFREVGREELPPDLLEKYPAATGALLASIKFLLDTDEGAGIFKRIKSRAVNQYSIGYDPIKSKPDVVKSPDGNDVRIRRLQEIRLWEISPVIFAANPATRTLGAKSAEGKPWDIFRVDDEYCIYRIDDSGERMGDSVGCHSTREEAEAQLRALYASEADKEVASSAREEEEDDESTPETNEESSEDSGNPPDSEESEPTEDEPEDDEDEDSGDAEDGKQHTDPIAQFMQYMSENDQSSAVVVLENCDNSLIVACRVGEELSIYHVPYVLSDDGAATFAGHSYWSLGSVTTSFEQAADPVLAEPEIDPSPLTEEDWDLIALQAELGLIQMELEV